MGGDQVGRVQISHTRRGDRVSKAILSTPNSANRRSTIEDSDPRAGYGTISVVHEHKATSSPSVAGSTRVQRRQSSTRCACRSRRLPQRAVSRFHLFQLVCPLTDSLLQTCKLSLMLDGSLESPRGPTTCPPILENSVVASSIRATWVQRTHPLRLGSARRISRRLSAGVSQDSVLLTTAELTCRAQ